MNNNINQSQSSYPATFTQQQSLNLSQPSSYNPSVLSLYTGRQIQQKFYKYLLLNRKKQTQPQSYNLSFHLENKFLELEKTVNFIIAYMLTNRNALFWKP